MIYDKINPKTGRPELIRSLPDHNQIHAKTQRGVRLRAHARQASIWTGVMIRVADGRRAWTPLHLVPQVRADLARQGYILPLTFSERRHG